MTWRRRVRALACLLGTLLLSSVVQPSPARAEEPPTLRVSIDQVAPDTLPDDPDAEVEITGRVANESELRVAWVGVHFCLVDDWPTVAGRLAEALDPASGAGDCVRLNSIDDGNVVALGDAEGLAPGASAPFSVRAKVSQFSSKGADVRVIGALVRGVPNGFGNRTVGEARAAIARVGHETPLARIVRLSAPTALGLDGGFVDDSLGAELPRISGLIGVAEQPGVWFMLDPALREALRVASGKHLVAGAEVEADQAAQAVLARLDALVERGSGYRLPFGDPDLARQTAPEELAGVVRRAAASFDDPSLAGLPVAVVAGEAASDAWLSAVQGLGPELVLADNLVGVPGARGDARLVRPMVLPRLAATRIALAVAAAAAGAPALELVTDPSARPVEAPLKLVRPDEGARGEADLADASGPVADEERTNAVARALDRVEFAAEVTGGESLRLAGDRLASQALAGDRDTASAVRLLEAATARLVSPDDLAGVRLVAAGQLVMSASSNQFPITIVNELSVPVICRVSFDSENPQRLTIPPTDPITVGPGEQVTANFTPKAASKGIVRVRARLTSMGGEPFGGGTTMQITATATSGVGWIIIAASGAVMLGATAVRIKSIQAGRGGRRE